MLQEAERFFLSTKRLSLSSCARGGEMTLPCPGGQGGAAVCACDAVCPAGKSAAERRAGYRCVAEKAVPPALCASGGFVGAPGNAKSFARLSRGSVFPMPSRGENGGLCPHPPKGSIPWESLFGEPASSFPVSHPPKRRRRQAPARGLAAVSPSPPHAERNEAPMPPTRGAWVRLHNAEGTGWRHCRPRGRR